MRWVGLAAIADPILTGLLLVINPKLFGLLILGAELSAAGQALGRIGGIAMFALGLASWPAVIAAHVATPATCALLIYNLVATAYLSYLAVVDKMAGVLLWPAVALHGALAILLAVQLARPRDKMS